MLYEVYSNLKHCLFSKLPSASTRVRYVRAAAAAHPLEYDVSRCGAFQFPSVSCRPMQVRMWNDLPYTVFPTGMLNAFKASELCFLQFSVAQVLVGLRCT